MSSHREAPEIAKDPVADSTDLYAFVSPDAAGTVTMIANYIPLEGPAAGPNFYEFGDDVLYEIHIDNNGDGHAEVSYQFNFHSENAVPTTFLYNVGPIASLNSMYWNRRQFYSVTRVSGNGRAQVLAENLPSPVSAPRRSSSTWEPSSTSAIYGPLPAFTLPLVCRNCRTRRA